MHITRIYKMKNDARFELSTLQQWGKRDERVAGWLVAVHESMKSNDVETI